MSPPENLSRRQLLRRLALGVTFAPVALISLRQACAAQPLLAVTAPEAKAVNYVEDAKSAKGAAPGNTCANCALYQGANGSVQGVCQLFKDKDVKAAGWCSSWAAQM
jgi:hypothetical protein